MESVQVEIIQAEYESYWYADSIGRKFDVYEIDNDYVVKDDFDKGAADVVWRYITPGDCVEVQ